MESSTENEVFSLVLLLVVFNSTYSTLTHIKFLQIEVVKETKRKVNPPVFAATLHDNGCLEH